MKKGGEIYGNQFARYVTNGLNELSLFFVVVLLRRIYLYTHSHAPAHMNTCATVYIYFP